MNANEMFPSNYLKAAHLGDAKPVVQIENIEIVEVGEAKDKRPLISFVDKDKGLICNKTNWNTLIGLFGADTDKWVGKRIRLVTEEVSYQGKRTMAIRISAQPVTAKPVAKKVVDEPADDVPLDDLMDNDEKF